MKIVYKMTFYKAVIGVLGRTGTKYNFLVHHCLLGKVFFYFAFGLLENFHFTTFDYFVSLEN